MPATQTRCSVVIVEDDDGSREALVRLLRREGHRVLAAPTATIGIEQISNDLPTCVVLDLMLPDVNGVEVLRVIREHGWNIRVAVVTAVHDPEKFPGLLAQRPDVIFRKPINFTALIEWLAQD